MFTVFLGRLLFVKFFGIRGQISPLIVSILLHFGCNQRGCGYVMTEKEILYIVRPSFDKEMVNWCMPAGCSNTTSGHVSLFKFLIDGILRCKREKWKVTCIPLTCIFSDHFSKECFEVDSLLACQFGIKKMRWLKPATIPIHSPLKSKAFSYKGMHCR